MKIGVLHTGVVGPTMSRKLVELACSSRARREGMTEPPSSSEMLMAGAAIIYTAILSVFSQSSKF